MLIFKLFKARKMYKDGKLLKDDTEAGVTELAYDVIKPFAILITLGLGLITAGSFLFGYVLGHIGFLKPIFWIALILLIIARIIIVITRKILNKVSGVVVKEGKEVWTGMQNRFQK
jgi:4-hydroxybenzoate polyprenyltransferase